MPASKLLEYEELDRLGVSHRLDATEAQVLGNLHALVKGITGTPSPVRLSLDAVCSIHKSLMSGTRFEAIGGVLRTEQNWVGGNRVNPVGAAYVPPPPDLVPALLSDLIEFVNFTELPAVAVAAIAHAQFETIHPFADGNGRTGRALIHLILHNRGLTRVTIPPVSLLLATDKTRYISNLNDWRVENSEDVQGAVNNWVEYFANVLTLSCRRALEFEQHIEVIRQSWLQQIKPREGSAGRQLIDILLGTPVISIKTAQKLTGKSYPAARSAVLALEEAGILRQNAKNRKSGIYVADDIMQAFSIYERSLATLSGDTAVEKPRRAVPQRKC
jgi:Fic family protein